MIEMHISKKSRQNGRRVNEGPDYRSQNGRRVSAGSKRTKPNGRRVNEDSPGRGPLHTSGRAQSPLWEAEVHFVRAGLHEVDLRKASKPNGRRVSAR